jgi:hypothetical protein
MEHGKQCHGICFGNFSGRLKATVAEEDAHMSQRPQLGGADQVVDEARGYHTMRHETWQRIHDLVIISTTQTQFVYF